MKPSGYLVKRSAQEKATLDEMQRTIKQFMYDTLCVTLNEENEFGYKRLKKLEKDWNDRINYYWPALTGGMESDVFQERLDRAIMKFMPEDATFYPFGERYPTIKQLGYEPRRRR